MAEQFTLKIDPLLPDKPASLLGAETEYGNNVALMMLVIGLLNYIMSQPRAGL